MLKANGFVVVVSMNMVKLKVVQINCTTFNKIKYN